MQEKKQRINEILGKVLGEGENEDFVLNIYQTNDGIQQVVK